MMLVLVMRVHHDRPPRILAGRGGYSAIIIAATRRAAVEDLAASASRCLATLVHFAARKLLLLCPTPLATRFIALEPTRREMVVSRLVVVVATAGEHGLMDRLGRVLSRARVRSCLSRCSRTTS